MSWRDFYAPARQANRFGIRGPFYGKQGHRGQDFRAAERQSIPSYVKGRCVLNGHSSILGNYTVIKAGVWYYSWAHLLIGTRPDVGSIVEVGESIGKAAGRADDHGSAWSGAHCHTTKGLTKLSVVYGAVFDPLTTIKKARAAR